MSEQIPNSHKDLIVGPIEVSFSTVMPDGQPQTTVVWCDFDGHYVRVNTMSKSQKAKNMRANPLVTILAFEHRNPKRFIEVRGKVFEMTEEGAEDHLDGLAELYMGKSPYFGEVIPMELRERDNPVLCRIMPTRVITVGGEKS